MHRKAKDGNKLDWNSTISTGRPPSTVIQSKLTTSLGTQQNSERQSVPPALPTDDVVHVQVGSLTHRRSFHISKSFLSGTSRLFKKTAQQPSANDIDLPRDDPIAFDLFVEWLELQDSHVPYEPLCYSDEPWRSKAAEAWVLAKHIESPAFETYALSQFIANCALVDLSTWEFIEREVREYTSLRQFSNHWIAWNCWLAAPEQSEYAALRAARLQGTVIDDTKDPRTYDLHHWFSPCGAQINPGCAHDPITQKNTMAAAGEKSKSEYISWGRDWELNYQASQSNNRLKP